MAKKSRYRYRSEGDPMSFDMVPVNSGRIVHSSSFYFERKFGVPINNISTLNVFGNIISISPPPTYKNSSGAVYYDNTNGTYLSSVRSSFREQFDSQFTAAIQAGPSNRAYHLKPYKFKEMSDVVTPQFRRIKGSNDRVVNPCNSSKAQFFASRVGQDTSNLIIHNVRSGGQNAYGASVVVDWELTWSPEVGCTDDAYFSIISYLENHTPTYANLPSMYADAFSSKDDAVQELLVILAEAKETITFIGETVRAVGEIFNAVKRRDFSFLGKKAKQQDIADLYLRARYAVRPLIIEAENALKLLADQGFLAKVNKTSRTSLEGGGGTFSIPAAFGSIEGEANVTYVYEEHASAGLYSRLRYDVPWLHKLGLTNTTKAAWEAIPWSFVFDWFVNMAGVLTALNPNPIYEPLSGWTAIRRTWHYSGSLDYTVNGTNIQVPISGTFERYHRNKEKEPSPIVIDFNLNIWKTFDLLAFARQIL